MLCDNHDIECYDSIIMIRSQQLQISQSKTLVVILLIMILVIIIMRIVLFECSNSYANYKVNSNINKTDITIKFMLSIINSKL